MVGGDREEHLDTGGEDGDGEVSNSALSPRKVKGKKKRSMSTVGSKEDDKPTNEGEAEKDKEPVEKGKRKDRDGEREKEKEFQTETERDRFLRRSVSAKMAPNNNSIVQKADQGEPKPRPAALSSSLDEVSHCLLETDLPDVDWIVIMFDTLEKRIYSLDSSTLKEHGKGDRGETFCREREKREGGASLSAWEEGWGRFGREEGRVRILVEV